MIQPCKYYTSGDISMLAVKDKEGNPTAEVPTAVEIPQFVLVDNKQPAEGSIDLKALLKIQSLRPRQQPLVKRCTVAAKIAIVIAKVPAKGWSLNQDTIR